MKHIAMPKQELTIGNSRTRNKARDEPMHEFRVTKYDPARRDTNGAFLDDDWTDASEIGKEIGGKVLDHETYFAVEAAYGVL